MKLETETFLLTLRAKDPGLPKDSSGRPGDRAVGVAKQVEQLLRCRA